MISEGIPAGRSGLTLIELLVVIGVIAILALLLFPATNGWLERAQETTCLSNLKVLGQAIFSYSSDNDGAFPSGKVPADMDAETARAIGTSNNDRMMMALFPYAPSQKLFRCPAIMSNDPSPYFAGGAYRSNYNQNVYTLGVKAVALLSTSKMILIYEGLPILNYVGTPPHHQVNAYPVSSTVSRHRPFVKGVASMNALMADGHIERGLRYLGWNDPQNTMPSDSGIWGGDRYNFNR